MGKVAYKLSFPDHSRVHPIFHISLLKKWSGPSATPAVIPESKFPTVAGPIPAAILARRTIHTDYQHVVQVLVEWQGLSRERASWENLNQLKTQFPTINLEDKVVIERVTI